MIPRLQIKKRPFTLVLVSEHSQVSEINVAVIRKLCVKKYLASAEEQKQQQNFVFRHFDGFILKVIALAYVTFLVLMQQV